MIASQLLRDITSLLSSLGSVSESTTKLPSIILPATPPGSLAHCAADAFARFVGLQQTRSRPTVDVELLLCTQSAYDRASSQPYRSCDTSIQRSCAATAALPQPQHSLSPIMLARDTYPFRSVITAGRANKGYVAAPHIFPRNSRG
jgi:hypothetical protein